MLEVLEPTDVIVHGCMPKSIFEEFESWTRFIDSLASLK